MSDFRFAEPQWAHALWAVLLLTAGLIALEIRSNRSLDQFLSRTLQSRLVGRTSRALRIVRAGLLGCCGIFLVLAAMRPQLGLTFVETPRVGAEIMVCLDVSRSMLAEDVVPNRLERSKAEIKDLLPYLEGDQIGLIAFAGRASILCPLTPDFSFLRLVLDEVKANSVGRGGTRLEEPIRKAIDAFGDSGDSARAILLISDGEDHDSFPLEACDLAKERGIQIIAIGIGDPGGAPIEITNPKTGAREPLYDSDGTMVSSRLDVETLSAMALRTDGLYIPAETNALDLEEIHRNAIAPLMRGSVDGGGRSIRQEAYQWPALAALITLLGAAIAGGRSRGSLPAVFTAALLLSFTLFPTSAVAQSTDGTSTESPTSEEGSETPPDDSSSSAGSESTTVEKIDPAIPPRELHNMALAAFDRGEFDVAAKQFEKAERDSGLDVELRYRCRYHLGWIAIRRADPLVEAAPEDALEALEEAAGHFRDAIRSRPSAREARHNLEVVLGRIRVLKDSMREQDERDLAGRLDELIERQRALLAEARSLIERDVADPNEALAEPRRREYRAVAATELQILSAVERFARDAEEERRSIEAKPEEERTPEDQVRAAQLTAMVGHLTRAQERLGQARRTLRRQQGERAARRASLGLSALKRSREQLRDALQVLDGLLPDARALTRQGLEWLRGVTPGLTEEQTPPPPWITPASLAEESEEIAARVGELAERFRGAAESDPGEIDPNDPEAQQRARSLERVREALPHLESSRDSYSSAQQSYLAEQAAPGFQETQVGFEALLAAREIFLDTKGLIEVIWRDESQVYGLLLGGDGVTPELRSMRVPAVGELHEKNVGRLKRLRTFINEEEAEIALARQQLESAAQGVTDPSGTGASPPSEEEVASLEERIRIVQILLDQIDEQTRIASEWFASQSELDPTTIDARAGAEIVKPIIPLLADLRRLYFTLLELLRDTARRQLDLNDQTADAIALALGVPEDAPKHLLPLGPEQTEIQQIAQQLAPAIEQQGEQMASFAERRASEGGGSAPEGESPEEVRQRWQRAAELVQSATGEMGTAITELFTERPFGEEYGMDAGGSAQRAALEQLAEAIELLSPEPPPQDPGDSSQQPQQNQNQSQSPDQEPNREPVDPAQLLQEVRDREAKRRADQQRDGIADPTVEKDW